MKIHGLHIRLSLLSLLSFMSLSLPALGLEPYLVKDINPLAEPADSNPDAFAVLGSVALFSASAEDYPGRELWRSDGTEAGTWRVEDLCQQTCFGRLRSFAVTDRAYFFIASSGDVLSLWATNGTPARTFRLTGDLVRIGDFRTRIGNILYFTVWDEGYGEELWRSDGTPEGTYRLSDLWPGPESSGPRWLTPFKGSLYFSAYDARVGGALWKTDGTAAGTVVVKDPVPQFPASAAPEWLQVVGNRLVFVAPAANQPETLWSSDGTARGTEQLRGVFTAGRTRFRDFSVQGSRLYFIAEDSDRGQELWVTDGTAKGTQRLTNLPGKRGFFGDNYFLPLPRKGLGNRFVFAAFDGQHGVEPWITDGTAKGTHLLKDLCPGACYGLSTVWERGLPGRLFLTGTNGTRGRELWVTDGTEAGTRLVRDICRGSCDASPAAPFAVNGRLVFTADDGLHGSELWSTDGTGPGTVRLSDFVPEHPWESFGGVVVGGQLFFSGAGPEGRELWRTDGTGAGTRLVRDINQSDIGSSGPTQLMTLGDQMVFFTFVYKPDGHPDLSLWKSDGTEAGTLEIRAFTPDDLANGGSFGKPSVEAGGQLFFYMNASELWRTDGTGPGTYRLTRDDVRICCSGIELEAVGGKVFFSGQDLHGGTSLWVSDGTVAGTRQVRDVPSASWSPGPDELTEFRGKLYFADELPDQGRELWRSDGTNAGTVLVKDIRPGGDVDSVPSLLTVHADRLWFFANDGVHGRELWSSDGSAAGTVLAVDLEPGPDSFTADALIPLGDRLLLFGSSPSRGSGLWVTDGTPAGTRKISDHSITGGHGFFKGRLYYHGHGGVLWVTDGTEAGTGPFLDRDGLPIPYPVLFAVLGDRLYFDSGSPGVPLWESDGTPAGTFQVMPETLPGPGYLADLVRAGSHVFFPAYSRDAGVELWAVEEEIP